MFEPLWVYSEYLYIYIIKHYEFQVEREITNWIIYTTESKINGPDRITTQLKHNNCLYRDKRVYWKYKTKTFVFFKKNQL